MKRIFSFFIACVIIFSLGFGGNHGFAATKINQDELNTYLAEIRMSQAELIDYLAYYDLTMADFESVEDLRDTCGPAATPETLQELLNDYEMTEKELTNLLMDYGELEEGDSILDTFHFIYDIEDIIDLDSEEDMDYEDEDLIDLMDDLFTEIDLTEEELERFMNHLLPIVEEPTFEDRLMTIADKMEQLEAFETIDELSAAQVAEMLSIYDELQNLLQIQFKFSLTHEGVTSTLSLESLFKLEDLTNASLLVSIYDLSGNLLLDFNLTGEMIGSDLVKDTGNDLKQTTKVISKVAEVKKEKPKHKTEKGALMPKTSGNYLFGALIGLAMIALAFRFIRKAMLVK
ncbi:processed acidic surface protein [Peribacillus sp. NPDC097675]|uniref:processed acidic surface protein n=1 Tax=Peribacillus sp. NPDC097675 TaxID=3390618 RepID=UPI003D06091C